ncbi:PilZ domain-containing protein [Allosphingosinicella humi]
MASGDATQGNEEAADHRARRRVHVLLPATIDADGWRWDVRLRNLSCTGALVETGALLAPGVTIVFTRGGVTRTGAVIWVRNRRMGLAFDQPLTETEVAVLTRR